MFIYPGIHLQQEISWESKVPTQEIAGPNSRPYLGKPMGFHSPLMRPAIYWGGSFGGGTLDSHEDTFA